MRGQLFGQIYAGAFHKRIGLSQERQEVGITNRNVFGEVRRKADGLPPLRTRRLPTLVSIGTVRVASVLP